MNKSTQENPAGERANTPQPVNDSLARTRFIELDGLKGISTTFVVAAHIDIRPVFWAWSWMDMFFVLSSFLLTRIAYKKCTDFRSVIAFSGRRIERIWPLYFLTISLLFVTAAVINHVKSAAVFDLTAFARLYTFSQYSEMLFQPVANDNYIYLARHTWSLALEEQFYVLLPLAVLLLRRTSPLVWLTVLVSVIVLSITQRIANPNMYILTSHLDAFAFGSLVAIGFQEFSAHARLMRRLLLCLALVSLALFIPYVFEGYAALLKGDTEPRYEAWPATFSVVFWASSIGLLALNRGAEALSLLRHPALVRVGNLSYAIYLVHYPILKLVPNQLVAQFPGLTHLTAELLCLPLIWLLAEFLYRTIDRPLQERRPTNLGSSSDARAITG